MSFNYITKKYEGYIYLLKNSINGKIYIGQTKRTIEERIKDHIYAVSNKEKKNKMYDDIGMVGIDSFEVSAVETVTCDTKEELKKQLDEKEYYYIELYNSDNEDIGYNDSLGGHAVRHGFKNVKQYDIDGNLIKTWRMPSYAAKALNISVRGIRDCCNGHLKTAGGYVWRKSEDDFKKYDVKGRTRIVRKYDLNGNLLESYVGLKEAAKSNNCSITTIKNVCINYQGISSFNDFVFRYNDDPFNKYEVKAKPHGNAVVQLTKDGKYISEYDNATIASKAVGTINSNICNVCNHKNGRVTAYGYKWMWKSEYNENKEINKEEM